ncbi:MAG: response regulator [Phycisphaerae bacterium]|nr:response regulator [Phycisphaerae bacterium]
MRYGSKYIAVKLLAGILFILGLTLFISSYMLITQGRDALLEQINAQGNFLAESASAACVEPMLLNDYPVLETYAHSMATSRDSITFIRIERTDGTLVASYPNDIADNALLLSHSRVYTQPIKVGSEEDTALGKVIVGISTKHANAVVRSYIRSLTTRGVTSFIAIALLLAILLKGVVTGPLKKLDRHVRALGSGDLHQPIQLKSRDEIGRLGRALDVMRENLKSSYVSIQIQNEELKELDRLKDEFLANITHELKTPLNGILGLGRGILQGDYGQVGERLYKPMLMMEHSAQRLSELCNQILTFSRQKNSVPTVDLETFHLSSRLHKILEQNECLFKQKGLGFSCQVPPELYIKADPSVFDHVFMNLVSNAVKFTSSGWVKIHACLVGQDVVAISVQDTGIGIPSEMHEAIFVRFRQGFASENREYEGSGIGLSIAQQAAHQMGGKICLESAVNAGAIFTVLLPLEKKSVDEGDIRRWQATKTLSLCSPKLLASASQGGEPPASKSQGDDADLIEDTGDDVCQGPTVLVVDDDEISREVIHYFLERHHYIVKQAANGPECLELLAREHVDLVLLDLMMPIMSGYEVLDQIKAMKPCHRPLVIVLSAKNQCNSIVKALKCGAMDYMTKPFDRGELLIRIKNLLELTQRNESRRTPCQGAGNSPLLCNHLAEEARQAIQTSLDDIITVIDFSLEKSPDPVGSEQLKRAKNSAHHLLSLMDPAEESASSHPESEPVEDEPRHRQYPCHFSGKVLLADDQLTSQTECRAVLEDMGFEVDLAQDGEETVRMGLSRPYELVIINMMMSETDGYYAASHLRIQGMTAPVIALLAYGEDELECQRIGCDAHLEKPVVPWELYRIICRLLPLTVQGS